MDCCAAHQVSHRIRIGGEIASHVVGWTQGAPSPRRARPALPVLRRPQAYRHGGAPDGRCDQCRRCRARPAAFNRVHDRQRRASSRCGNAWNGFVRVLGPRSRRRQGHLHSRSACSGLNPCPGGVRHGPVQSGRPRVRPWRHGSGALPVRRSSLIQPLATCRGTE